jgi:hypothetical protein
MDKGCVAPQRFLAMLSEEAKSLARHEAQAAQNRGTLCSSEEAWAAAGKDKIETLWSIALRVSFRTEESAEDLCEFLEEAFPQSHANKRKLDLHGKFMGDDTQL